MKHINICSWKPSRIRTRMWFTHWYSSWTLRFQKLFDPVQLCERFMHLKLQILIFYSNIPQQEGSVEYLNFHTFPQALLCWHCRIILLPRCFGYQWDGARPRLECFKMCGGNTKLWNIISQHLPKEKTCTANQYTRTHCSRVINSFQRGSGARQTSKSLKGIGYCTIQSNAQQIKARSSSTALKFIHVALSAEVLKWASHINIFTRVHHLSSLRRNPPASTMNALFI